MRLRAAFMGSPDIALPSLHAVERTCDLRLVVTQPDRPVGRGRKVSTPPVGRAAQEAGISVLQPIKMRDGSVATALRALDLDVVIVVAFGRILPTEVLGVARHGCINVHFSVLPRWRGAAPVQRAILAGDRETGVSVMRMDAGLDTGPVYRFESTTIGVYETAGELSARLADRGAQVLETFLSDFPNWPVPTPQDPTSVTFAPPLRKEEGEVDWDRPVVQIVDHVRGMDPWPGAFTFCGQQRLRVFRARPSVFAAEATTGVSQPGTVERVDAAGIHVMCRDGIVVVGEVQPENRPKMTAAAYAAGRRFEAGTRLG